jgi:hypothetical protein
MTLMQPACQSEFPDEPKSAAWPERLIPIREALREHAVAIGREHKLDTDGDLAMRYAAVAPTQRASYAAAALIGKTIWRRHGPQAVRRQPWPRSLAYWVTLIRDKRPG